MNIKSTMNIHMFSPWVKVKQSLYRPREALRFQEVKAPRFQDNRYSKVVSLSALRTGHVYPQEILLVLISCRGWVDPRAIVWSEKLCQRRISITPSGIEPATFRLGLVLGYKMQKHPVPLSEIYRLVQKLGYLLDDRGFDSQ
jgi:hypothetical protein